MSATLPPFLLESFLRLPLLVSLPLLRSFFFLNLSLTKLDPRPTGPDPRTGLSQLAYEELPQRSPDTVIEREQRQQRENSALETGLYCSTGGFLPSMWAHVCVYIVTNGL